jgi:hypothetical protein
MNAIASFYLIAYVLLRAELYITRALLLDLLVKSVTPIEKRLSNYDCIFLMGDGEGF